MQTRLASNAKNLRRRFQNTIFYVGDSRNAMKYLDPIKYNRAANGWTNWMEAYCRSQGRPLISLGVAAVSGSYPSQWQGQIDTAIASGARFICFTGIINAIAQQTPAGNVVQGNLDLMKKYIKQANDAGATAVLWWERGADNFNATHIANMNDYNRLMVDFIQYGDDDGKGPPDVLVLDQTPFSNVTSNNGTIKLKNTYDGTHDDTAAGQIIGLGMGPIILPHLRPLPGHRLGSVNQAKSGYGTRSMFSNGGLPGSVAATGTGNSGNVPTGLIPKSCTGGVTCVYSVQPTVADANGNTFGQEIKMVLTATAAGSFGIYAALDRSQVKQGVVVRGGGEVDLAPGATGFASVFCDLEWFPSTGGYGPVYDMLAASNLGNDPGRGFTGIAYEPDGMVIPAFTGTPYTNLAFGGNFNGPGQATVYLRKWWAEVASK